MKKSLALLLALIMSCTALVSCTEGDEESSVEKRSDKSSLSRKDNDSSEDESDDGSETDDSSVVPEDSSSELVDSDFVPDESSSQPVDISSVPDDSSSQGNKKPTPVRPAFSNGITVDRVIQRGSDERLFENLMKEITDKSICTMWVELEEGGFPFMMYMTMNEGNVYVDMDLYGTKITVLISDETGYFIDPANKRYYVDTDGILNEEISGEELLGEFATLDDMTYISAYTVTIDGDEYPMEKYTNEYGTEMCYVFDGANDLVAFKNGSDDYVPFTLSKTPDTSKFSLSGYTQMSEAEFAEWYYETYGE